MTEPRHAWPRKTSPLAGMTTQHTTYHCGGIIESHTLSQYHTCPTSTELPTGWTLHPEYGWLCPKCTESNGEPRSPMGKYQGDPAPLTRATLMRASK